MKTLLPTGGRHFLSAYLIAFRHLLSCIADLALPRVCVVCGNDLDENETVICSCCLGDIPLCRYEKLSHNPMADRLNARLEDGPYAHACALFFYRSEYTCITPALKYGRNFTAGKFFAGMLGKRLAQSPLYQDVDCIIPVPLHWTRLWRRGYNQAEIIAGEIVLEISRQDTLRPNGCIHLETRSLQRIRSTKSQTTLKADDKKRNVKGAFKADGKRLQHYRHILLVDDVFTTGNTLAESYKALRKVIPEGSKISIAALAFLYD